MGVKCVKCGGHNTAAYLYGLPVFDEQLEKDLETKKIILGGCVVTDLEPMFHCHDCQLDFGYSAKRMYEDGFVDYIEDTIYYMMSVNYVEYGETKFILYKENDKYFVEFHTPSNKYKDEISEKDYKKNLTTIFEKAYVLEWNENNERKSPVDTTDWRIEIKCNNGKAFTTYGKNYFPPYFRKAKTRHDYYSHKLRK